MYMIRTHIYVNMTMIFKSKKESSQIAHHTKTTERTFRQCNNNCLVQNDTSARVPFVRIICAV